MRSRRLIGRYAGLLIHVRDNQPWDQPVTKGVGIAKFTPVWAGALTPKDFEENPDNENYGLPTWWEYKERINSKTIARKIHPDRIFIFGDYSDDAIAFLEPSYNAFVSLEKVEGGSGESFLKTPHVNWLSRSIKKLISVPWLQHTVATLQSYAKNSMKRQRI